jgi:AcrR family transcriptional regulator
MSTYASIVMSKSKAESPESGPYHHGNLREALLDAVGEIISEKGVGGVSLREAARRAGVSHGAPAHHFGDKLGLLTAYSTRGFEQFGERMRDAAAAAETPTDKIVAVGFEYLRFATEERAYFEVMFRSDMHNSDDTDLIDCSIGAFSVLTTIAEELAAEWSQAEATIDVDPELVALRSWSMVHGLATLWIDGAMTRFWDGNDIFELALKVFETEMPTLN